MFVFKRDGRREPAKFDKITERLSRLRGGLHETVDPARVAQKVIQGMHTGITTVQLDELAASVCASLATEHPDFSTLAARVVISSLHKETADTFSGMVRQMTDFKNAVTGKVTSLLRLEVVSFVLAYADEIDAMIQHERDYDFDYFGFKTLERGYLQRVNNKIVERPQYLWMRVAIELHMHRGPEEVSEVVSPNFHLSKIKETYNHLSWKHFTHATPTLFNAASKLPALSSCFLLSMDDSLQSIFHTLSECAQISKFSGGIGIAAHRIRATNSYIESVNGYSNGIIPMLRVFNNTARYVNQGGRRNGSIAVYLEPWHADVESFLLLKRNHGNENERARDLFYAMWIPDLFMQRVEQNAMWSLFCPGECPGLSDVYGSAFVELYTKYEQEGKARKQMPAQQLWNEIIQSQIETGNPYMLYKDHANAKSNHQHLGTIQSSNLCAEVMEYTKAGEEVAVCNLGSINLTRMVTEVTVRDPDIVAFNFEQLRDVTQVIIRNLNKVIDLNRYPVPDAESSNHQHRPIGCGVQGLADVFAQLNIPFESEQATELNQQIFEMIYFTALETSCQLAREYGSPYPSYAGSPMSKGILQPDMWNVQLPTVHSERLGLDWANLRAQIAEHGVRNSLLIAIMPTASTAQILGSNESVEPFTSNIYTRRVLAGEFTVVNKYLIKELIRCNMWTPEIRSQIIAGKGSIQHIETIPEHVRELFKTVWEISQRTIINHAADRGPFVCQSQSMNLHVAQPSLALLTSMHFYAWKRGLKTGSYYIRTRPKVDAMAITTVGSGKVVASSAPVEAGGDVAERQGEAKEAEGAEEAERRGEAEGDEEDEGCVMCSA